MKQKFPIIFCCLVLITAVMFVLFHSSSGVLGITNGQPNETTITINTEKDVASVPDRFLGFSFETENLCNLVGPWNTPVFTQLVKNLGVQVIRIGGNSADKSLWSSASFYECSASKTVITKQLIDSFFQLAQKLGTKVMWTLNLGNYAPSTYSQEAQYVFTKGEAIGGSNGSYLWALGIGNEPDLYPHNGMRPSSYSISDFINEWNAYKDTIKKLPHMSKEKFMGPDIADNDVWFATFAKDEKSNLSRLTHHYYALHKNNISPSETPQQLIEILLSPSLMHQTARTFDGWKAEAKNIPLVVNESNSVTGGGYKGVSDTFASTLWGIDYILTAMEHGVVQLNLHTGGLSAYSPLAFSANGQITVRPLYYAMLFSHLAAPTGKAVATSIKSSHNIAAHSILDKKGILRIAIINKDVTASDSARITINKQYHSAEVFYLTAPSVDATNGILFGGSAIQANATWNGKGQKLTIRNNSVTVNLPRTSAALIIFN